MYLDMYLKVYLYKQKFRIKNTPQSIFKVWYTFCNNIPCVVCHSSGRTVIF